MWRITQLSILVILLAAGWVHPEYGPAWATGNIGNP